MKIRSLLCIIVLSFVVNGIVLAKKKAEKKYVTLIEAYSQRNLPGVRRATPPPPTFHFIIVWEDRQYPDAFFWRADTGLFACYVAKAHKTLNKVPRGVVYNTEKIALSEIHKGDTLDVFLLPHIRSANTVGMQVDDSVKNTLFFTTAGSKRHSIYVGAITKKHDIAMP